MNQQHEEIGRMFAEKRMQERKLACLRNKLDRVKQKLDNASASIANRNEEGYQVAVDDDMPTCRDIIVLIQEESATSRRIGELDEYLSKV